jgi:hypothetical protein
LLALKTSFYITIITALSYISERKNYGEKNERQNYPVI